MVSRIQSAAVPYEVVEMVKRVVRVGAVVAPAAGRGVVTARHYGMSIVPASCPQGAGRTSSVAAKVSLTR